MQSAYTNNNNNDGSPEGRITLQALAHSLNIDEAALKVVLEAAFDLLPSVQNPGLALQMTLIRQGYRFESEAFWAVMHALRRNFGGVFDTNNGRMCLLLQNIRDSCLLWTQILDPLFLFHRSGCVRIRTALCLDTFF